MARHEADREDLMREAIALTRRIELVLPYTAEHLIAGYRTNGALSLYFGPDPVFQFDASGRLRRGFVAGCLYRTQGGTLARLTRVRRDAATVLQRHDLDNAERESFIEEMTTHLTAAVDAIRRGQYRIVAVVPPDDDVLLSDLAASLEQILRQPSALAPRIRGKP